MKLDRVKRRTYWVATDNLSVMLQHVAGGFDRALRWYGAGLTEKERVYAQHRSIQMKQVADDMSYLRQRIHNHLNGVKGPVKKSPRR